MSSFLQSYCDVTESLAFKSSDIYSSSSCDSTNPNTPKLNQLKCFNCFGANNKTQYCSHCGGTSYVTDSHPLAVLFGDILCQKLGAIPLNEPIWTELNRVETIREEEEDLEERKIICDLCNVECDSNYKYYCQCYQCFYVCVQCADQKGDQIDHQHPLATNKQISIPSLTLKRTDSTNVVSKNNSPAKQQNQDFFNINDIISQDFRLEFRDLVKTHLSDSSQFDDFQITDQVIIKKSFAFQRQNIVDSQDSKGLFGSKLGQKKQHFWEVNEQGKLVKAEPEKDSLSIFFDEMKPASSRILGGSKISVRESIEFNIFDHDAMGMSTGPGQSFGLGRESIAMEWCNHCGTELKEIYSICRTCENLKMNFRFCCECQDTKSHNHDNSHKFETVLDNVLGGMSQMVSESAIQSQQEDADFLSMKMTKKKSSLQKRPPRLPQQQSFDDDGLSGKKSFCKLKCAQSFDLNSFVIEKMQIKANRFGEQSVVNLDFDGLYNSTEYPLDLEETKTQNLQKQPYLLDVNNSIENPPHVSQFTENKESKPRVCFAQTLCKDDDEIPIQFVESGSDSQSQQESPKFIDLKRTLHKTINRTSHRSIRSMKSINYTQTEDAHMTTSSTRQITSSISYNRSSIRCSQRQYQSHINEREQRKPSTLTAQVQQFIFHHYTCDQCGCNPIKNVRYHCLECEDYDLCGDCFDSDTEVKHAHDFQKIDGLKKMQEQRTFLLQRKDLNKGRESLVRGTNVGMLAKTKRTVEMMKKGVNQLNSSVMNVTRSFGSYGETLGQRMSLRQKVQS